MNPNSFEDPKLYRESKLIIDPGYGTYCAVYGTYCVVMLMTDARGRSYYMLRDRANDLNTLKAKWRQHTVHFITFEELMRLPLLPGQYDVKPNRIAINELVAAMFKDLDADDLRRAGIKAITFCDDALNIEMKIGEDVRIVFQGTVL